MDGCVNLYRRNGGHVDVTLWSEDVVYPFREVIGVMLVTTTCMWCWCWRSISSSFWK